MRRNRVLKTGFSQGQHFSSGFKQCLRKRGLRNRARVAAGVPRGLLPTNAEAGQAETH